MLKEREKNIKVAISKDSLNSNLRHLLEKVVCVRKNNFNTTSTSVIDGHLGDAEIANHFQASTLMSTGFWARNH